MTQSPQEHENTSPFTDEQKAALAQAAVEAGSMSAANYILRYIAAFGVHPALQHLCNNWQVRPHDAAPAFREGRAIAKEALEKIGIIPSEPTELWTGFAPGEKTDRHVVSTYIADPAVWGKGDEDVSSDDQS